MTGRVLVAGVGNIFKSDDGFATEVVRWLERHAAADWPERVRLRDFGIGGVHLAYELLDGYDDVVLVDAMHRAGAAPGTLVVFEPDLDPSAAQPTATVDAHDLSPGAVLSMVPGLGGVFGRVTVVGCEPLSIDDGLGLTPVVLDRVPAAGRLVCELVTHALEHQRVSTGSVHRSTERR